MTLEQEIDAIYKLDYERTTQVKLDWMNTMRFPHISKEDEQFICSAPAMVAIIRRLEAENTKLKEDLKNLDFLSKAEAAWHREDYEKTKIEQEKLLVIVQKCSMQDYENFEEVRNEAIACLEIHCDICGDYHDWNYIPLNCQTGNGE